MNNRLIPRSSLVLAGEASQGRSSVFGSNVRVSKEDLLVHHVITDDPTSAVPLRIAGMMDKQQNTQRLRYC
jgi:hypothetical protein